MKNICINFLKGSENSSQWCFYSLVINILWNKRFMSKIWMQERYENAFEPNSAANHWAVRADVLTSNWEQRCTCLQIIVIIIVMMYCLLFNCMFPEHKTLTNGLRWCPDSRQAAASGGRWKPECFWHPSLKLFVLSKHGKYGPVFQRFCPMPLGSVFPIVQNRVQKWLNLQDIKIRPLRSTPINAWYHTDSSYAAAEPTWCNTVQWAAYSNLLFDAT